MCTRLAAVALTSALIATSTAHAGPLTPPAGVPSPTDTALRQTDPRIPVGPATTPGDAGAVYIITQPGSYYLTADVVGAMGQSGIDIRAEDVTLDLNGFAVRGVAGSSTGISATGASLRLTLHSGVVADWGNTGVFINFSVGSHIRDLRITGNGGAGIVAPGDTIIERVICQANLGDGFNTNGSPTFIDCVATENAANGFGGRGTFERCVARLNVADGFLINSGNLTACTADGNDGDGFELREFFGSITASNCAAYGNTVGFRLGRGATVTGCNATGNDDDGFKLDQGAVAYDCTAYLNADDGFELLSDTVVARCAAYDNTFGFFITVNSDRATIMDCTAINNDGTGILCGGPNALVIRNTAAGNTFDFNIAGTARFGPIVTGTGEITNANPHANFAATVVTTANPVTTPAPKHHK